MKRAWLGIALVFVLFEGAVYGVASWADHPNAFILWGLPKIVFVDEPDGTPLLLDEDEVRGSYSGPLSQLQLLPDGVALRHPVGPLCLVDSGPLRAKWSLDGSRLRVSSSSQADEILQVVASERRPALRDATGELWRASP